MNNFLEYHHDRIQLHSGGWSHWLVRGDLMFQDAQIREVVLNFWVNVLNTWRSPFNIVGIPTGGTPWAEELRQRVPTDYSFYPDAHTVIVDDVVTTGASIIGNGYGDIRLCVFDRRLRPHSVDSWMAAYLPVYEEEK